MRKINIHALALICLIKLKLGLTTDKDDTYLLIFISFLFATQ